MGLTYQAHSALGLRGQNTAGRQHVCIARQRTSLSYHLHPGAPGPFKVAAGRRSVVVKAALENADMIAANSPDAVIVTRESVKMGWEGVGAEDGTRISNDIWSPRLHGGENLKEGVRAFVEKRKPRYKPAKL